MELNKIICGDCLIEMPKIPNKSVDLILTDPPYGITALNWDDLPESMLDDFWQEAMRVGKENCAYVFTASQPFTTKLINSNNSCFRYCLVWDKVNKYTGAFNANKRPMKSHEDIVVFYKNQPTYNTQFRKGVAYTVTRPKGKGAVYGGAGKSDEINKSTGEKAYPGSIIRIEGQTHISFHPTQKPVSLMEHLIKMYSNKGDTILDPFAGSGTTGVACKLLKRNYILIEKEPEYVKICEERIKNISNTLF